LTHMVPLSSAAECTRCFIPLLFQSPCFILPFSHTAD
jgi:hypothetical protein